LDIQTRLQNDGIEVHETFFEKLQKYKSHLLQWNRVHNLTGARDADTLDEFIYDAVYAVKFPPKEGTLLDIGSGAGFPGMILAFALPSVQVTLTEPLAKRASFLQFIKADLHLDNVTVKKSRVEEIGCQTFDIITSRAVTNTKILLQLSKPFCHEKTKLLFFKGEKVHEEIEDAKNCRIIETQNRHYLIIENVKEDEQCS
jgi:16S rRNA (guanine527-N7)-methyltransferase